MPARERIKKGSAPILAAMSLAVSACAGVSELSVGAAPTQGEGGTGTLGSTLLDNLEAKCAAATGASDGYMNAAELSSRLNGRWYHCASIGNWSLPRGTGTQFQLGAQGNYAFLGLNATEDSFVASADPMQRGQIVYHAFTGTSTFDGGDAGGLTDVYAGGGVSEMEVPINDMTTRNGFFVYLEASDGNTLEFQVLFEQNPPKLHLNELGGAPALATFVPID